MTAAERAYRTIREKIVSLEFAPNAAIGEAQLAAMLGVSRTPVREALARLGSEGLVDFRSRAGTIVAPIRLEAVRAAQFVREKLETSIIEEAALRSSEWFRFRIRQEIEEQCFAMEQGDAALFFASDERMHQSFSETAGLAHVWPVVSDAKKHMDRVRWLSLEAMDRLQLLLRDHREILEALEERDAQRARGVMERHLGRVMDQFDGLMAAHPEYFERARAPERMAV